MPPLRRIVEVGAALLVLAGSVAAAVLLELRDRPVPGSDPFARGPYLTRVTETGARLRWIARDGAPVEAAAIAPDGSRAAAARDGVLRGLRPDTRYRWTASIAGAVRAAGCFTTAPRRLDRQAHLRGLRRLRRGDRRRARGWPRRRLRRTRGCSSRPGTTATWRRPPPCWTRTSSGPCAPCSPSRRTTAWWATTTSCSTRAAGRWWRRSTGPAAATGSTCATARSSSSASACAPTPPICASPDRALSRSGPAARFVLVHQPPKAGNPLLPLLAARGVTAVLAGHLHAYERRERPEAPGVPLLTVGTGGAPRSSGRTPRSDDARVHLAEYGLLRGRRGARAGELRLHRRRRPPARPAGAAVAVIEAVRGDRVTRRGSGSRIRPLPACGAGRAAAARLGGGRADGPGDPDRIDARGARAPAAPGHLRRPPGGAGAHHERGAGRPLRRAAGRATPTAAC